MTSVRLRQNLNVLFFPCALTAQQEPDAGYVTHFFKKIMTLKVAQWKNGFIKKPYLTVNMNFLFLSVFVYLLKNWSSQFFSSLKSAEPVFCNQKLSCLPSKNHDKSQFSEGEIQICCIVRSFYNAVFSNFVSFWECPNFNITQQCFAYYLN